MKKIYFFFVLLSTFGALKAQYNTPDLGLRWNLDSIAVHDPETVVVSDTAYYILKGFFVSLTDSLFIEKNSVVKIAKDVEVRVKGHFTAKADSIIITAVNIDSTYKGLYFEETASAWFENTSVSYGGGIRVITANFQMYNCEVSYNASGSSTGSAIGFSRGKPIVKNSVFKYNFNPALSSGANTPVAAIFEGNYFEANNQRGNNRPQINMGPSGEDTIKIINNVVIGDRALTVVGGISASSLLGTENHIVISGNIVKDNRYAVTTAGPNTTGIIADNVLEDNNTETNPNNGGSGISLYNTGLVHITNNQIRRNLWGVTIIGTAMANLGSDDQDDYNEGGNVFSENGNGGVTYALFNNTPNTIKALHNCWIEGQASTKEQADSVIFDVADISTLGEVIYDPFECGITTSLTDLSNKDLMIFPNPAHDFIQLNLDQAGRVRIYDVNGRLVSDRGNLSDSSHQLSINLNPGMYLITVTSSEKMKVRKLLVE
ncbi:MAG: T9SS type A sorting domain-containing protein [Saprospiraceae bacterium]|nr:T9SS type A sorting domain-containing protein [Saprospiraceae bacterium]